VDNVDLACNEDDIRAHVSSLGVEVLSCFKAIPRRRPHESVDDVSDRRAFRLGVNAADRDRLLNPDVWPDSIRISEWFFHNKEDREEKRQRVNESGQRGVVSPSRSSVAVGDVAQRGHAKHNQNDQQALNDQQEVVVAASVTTAASVEVMDTISVAPATHSDDCDEQDAYGDQTTIYQYGEC